MGVPTSEVGYTSAMPRREDREVRKDMWGHWTKKKKKITFCFTVSMLLTQDQGLRSVNYFSLGKGSTDDKA